MAYSSGSAAENPPRGIALLPFLIFVLFYLGLSLWARDFQKVPMPTAFLVASAFALCINRRYSLSEKIDVFARGMGDGNIMLMCLIFILAGAFAAVTQKMGAVEAAVLITRRLMPPGFMLAGMFLISGLISLAVGTSCGTIAALTPIAIGIVSSFNLPPEPLIGAIIGGAMFGDNLSMISDTTIAATRTQNVPMEEKFFTNLKMVLPAVIFTIVLYLFAYHEPNVQLPWTELVTWRHLLAVSPYLLILLLALRGWNVTLLLFSGIILAGMIGMLNGAFSFWDALGTCGSGCVGMAGTLIIAMLAGGLLALIRWNGGIAWMLTRLTRSIHSPRGCEAGICLLTGAVNLFTANNTVAIVIAGPIAKELADRFHCSPRRVAGLLDTTSCMVQGVIPYGAQILIAAGIAQGAGVSLSLPSLIGCLYYQWLMLLAILITILFSGRTGKKQA